MTAKEFYENQLHDKTVVVGRLEKDEIIELMQAYHESKMKEVTDEDIKKWIDKRFARVSRYGLGKSIGAFIAAKAFRDGEIKCNREV